MKQITCAVSTLLIISTLLTPAIACVNGRGIVPENNLSIPVNKSAGTITQDEFNEIISKAVNFYSPIFTSKGGKLTIEGGWDDGTVNAYADREDGKWIMQLYGGMARHSAMTPDAYALIVCHEVGHHIGGAPLRGYPEWAASEGQADYFATTKCLREMFLHDDNAAKIAKMVIPPIVRLECEKSWPNRLDADLCIRSSMAGHSATTVFQALASSDEVMDFAKPDPYVTPMTITYYPDNQCRLDTYFNGANCEVDKTVEMSWTDETIGTCHQSQTQRGVRPICWYIPATI